MTDIFVQSCNNLRDLSAALKCRVRYDRTRLTGTYPHEKKVLVEDEVLEVIIVTDNTAEAAIAVIEMVKVRTDSLVGNPFIKEITMEKFDIKATQ